MRAFEAAWWLTFERHFQGLSWTQWIDWRRQELAAPGLLIEPDFFAALYLCIAVKEGFAAVVISAAVATEAPPTQSKSASPKGPMQ